MLRVEHFLTLSTQRFPARTALVAGERRITYAELEHETSRMAAALEDQGFQRGDRAIIFMDNCWQAVVAVFAVLKAGGVFSPVNASTKADKLSFILNNCRATAIFTQGSVIATARAARMTSPSVKWTIVADSPDFEPGELQFHALLNGDGREAPSRFAGISTDLAMLIYTSGSTGFPKGVMMTHQNINAAATSIITYLENTSDDIILNALPMSFDYGLYQVLMAVKTGATLILEKSFTFPAVIFQKIRDEKVTGFPLVPTMAALILNMRDLKPGDYPALRYLTNTAAALPPAHIQRLRELFPTATVFSMYGLTECKRCTWLPPAELDRRAGSVGVAIPGTEAYVVDGNGHEVPAGGEGELVIRGPHVMQGYWENEAATAKALRPGRYPWERVLYTGDVFRTDEDGFLYFVGRKDDIIKTKGEKVSPKEIENILYALPGIREAAVIGVPDPILGSALRAVIARDSDTFLTEIDIIRHCARHLEDFMVPRQVEFRDALPKTDSGKISRRLIIEQLGINA
jgi:long-chain acyl-CoA synthetase